MKTVNQILSSMKKEITGCPYFDEGDDGLAIAIQKDGFTYRIIASWGKKWEHVSISLEDRCPTWDEMCWIKSLFWNPEETVMQLHPPESRYVNQHPFCLHLWKPQRHTIPLPPTEFVGIKT